MVAAKRLRPRRKRGRIGEQLGLDLARRKAPGRRGGARKGAGRKKGNRVLHEKREIVRSGQPVHVTLRLLPEASGLRRRRQYQAIRAVMRRCGQRDEFTINQYSVQDRKSVV